MKFGAACQLVLLGNSIRQKIVQADTNVPAAVLRVGITEGFNRKVEKEITVQRSTKLKPVSVNTEIQSV
jgi:hypothetical protein